MVLLFLIACTGLRSVVPDVIVDDTDRLDTDTPDSDPATTDDSDPPGFDSTPLVDDTDPPADSTPPAETGTPPPTPWSAPLTVDGVWDCPPGAELATTTAQVAGQPRMCVTWTTADLFVAVQHPDVASPTASHFLWIYAGPGQGTTTGVTYNTQTPSLPQPVDRHLRCKLDTSFHSLMTWTAGAWSDGAPGYLATPGRAVARANDILELRVPLADLGVTQRMTLAAGLLFEGAGFESTYAGVPDRAFVDGYDPDVAHVWRFDLTSPHAPVFGAIVP